MRPLEHISLYSLRNQKQLNKTCEPLLTFGIDVFWTWTITEDGHMSYLGNVGHIAEYFYDQHLYRGHPSFKAPSLQKSEIVLGDYDNSLETAQKPVFNRYNMHQLFMSCHKQDNIFRGYAFATTKDLPSLANTYINNQGLLKKFIGHFHEQNASIINRIEGNKFDVKALVGDSFYEDSAVVKPKKSPIEIFSAMIDGYETLTSRESECLHYLVQGMTARQIGHQLGISFRTVQHYLDNIKDKWQCSSRSELIGKALRNGALVL